MADNAGSISQALAPAKVPSQPGSVVGDISQLVAGFMMGAQEEKRYREEQALEQARVDALAEQVEAQKRTAEAAMKQAEAANARVEVDRQDMDLRRTQDQRTVDEIAGRASYFREVLPGVDVAGYSASRQELDSWDDDKVNKHGEVWLARSALEYEVGVRANAQSRDTLIQQIGLSNALLDDLSDNYRQMSEYAESMIAADAASFAAGTFIVNPNDPTDIVLRGLTPTPELEQQKAQLMESARQRWEETNPQAVSDLNSAYQQMERARTESEFFREVATSQFGMVYNSPFDSSAPDDGRITRAGYYAGDTTTKTVWTFDGITSMTVEDQTANIARELDDILAQPGGATLLKRIYDYWKQLGPVGKQAIDLAIAPRFTEEEINKAAFDSDESIRQLLDNMAQGGPVTELPDPEPAGFFSRFRQGLSSQADRTIADEGPPDEEARTNFLIEDLARIMRVTRKSDIQNLDLKAMLTKAKELQLRGIGPRALIERLERAGANAMALESLEWRLQGTNPGSR